jgi:hypothetical protein
MAYYDLIDFGSGRGGCLSFSMTKFGIATHLGIDIQKQRVAELNKKGYNCIQGDITNIKLDHSAKIVTMSHLLEHLDSYASLQKVVGTAVKLSTSCVFIESPCFDFDTYLRTKGLKFYWSDWRGHKVKYTCPNLIYTLQKEKIACCDLLLELPFITSSTDPTLHSLTSPTDQMEYDGKIHPAKPVNVVLTPMYKSYIIFAWKNTKDRNLTYLQARKKFKLYKHYDFTGK